MHSYDVPKRIVTKLGVRLRITNVMMIPYLLTSNCFNTFTIVGMQVFKLIQMSDSTFVFSEIDSLRKIIDVRLSDSL